MQTLTSTIKPGTKVRTFLETNGFASGIKVQIPMLVAAGAESGPVLSVVACQHGRELNGIESIRRVFAGIDPAKMRGTLICFPVANPLAVRLHQQDFPDEKGRYHSVPSSNMNLSWPGNPDGSIIERITHAMYSQVICQSDFVIDFHGWTGQSMSMAFVDEGSRELGKIFGYELFFLTRKNEETFPLLDRACYRAGIPSVTTELATQNMIDEESIEVGIRGMNNVMRHLGILPGEIELPKEQYYITPETAEHLLRTDEEGMFIPLLHKNRMVKQHELLGIVASLETLEVAQEIRSPIDGLLYNIGAFRAEHLPESSIVGRGERVAIVKEVLPVW